MSKKYCSSMICLLAAVSVFFFSFSAARAEAVTSGSVQFTVTDYNFLPGLQSVVPTDGHQFLTVNVLMKTAADASEITDPEQYFLAVDENGRVFTPVLFNGSSSLTATLAPGEKNLRLLFEIPDAAAAYRLAVLDRPGGITAGTLNLGKSSGAVTVTADLPLAVLAADGYELSIYEVKQSATAFLDKAPDGMKYIWVDAAITGNGSKKTAAQIASAFAISKGSGLSDGVVPARATNLLAIANVQLIEPLSTMRGYLCFLVPEGQKELSGLTDGKAALAEVLPIIEKLNDGEFAQLDADGAYHQGDWKITVHGMRLADKGTLNPPSGSNYVIVNLTVSNQSTQNLTVSSELAFAMTDENANELTQAWFADVNDTLDAVLLPSESKSGDIAFLLPDGAKAKVLRVHLSMLGAPLMINASAYLSE